jgi:hypothetical protein
MAGDGGPRKIDALIQLEVACQLALEALPALGDEAEQKLREHVQALCEASGAELDRVKPGWRSAKN